MTDASLLRSAQCPPIVLLEYLAAGDPIPSAASEHVEHCQRCLAHLHGLGAGRSTFRASHPAEVFARKVERRAESALGPRFARWPFVAFGVGAAALIATVLVVFQDQSVRTKGVTGFGVYVKRGEGQPALLSHGAHARAGDVLRFHFEAPHDGYLMIIDVDGTGRVSAFHPFGGGAATPVSAGARVVIPESVALDSAPGPEHVGAVFRRRPFTFSELRAWVTSAQGAPPRLACDDCSVSWLLLERP